MLLITLLVSQVFAAMDIDSSHLATIHKDMPDCSGDYECTKALEVLEAQVRREAKAEIKSRDLCSSVARTFGGSKGMLKIAYVTDLSVLPDGSQFRYHVEVKYVCTVYQD